MRRRALLAASQSSGSGGTYDEFFGNIPPESTTFEFPLYITVPFVETENTFRVYQKTDDIIGQLKEWFFANADVYENMFIDVYELYDPNVYINGEKIEFMYADVFGSDFEHSTIECTSQIFNGSTCWCTIFSVDNKIDIRVQ